MYIRILDIGKRVKKQGTDVFCLNSNLPFTSVLDNMTNTVAVKYQQVINKK